MKRLITLLALIIVAIVSMAADRTAVVKTDQTWISGTLSFGTSDTICESDTVYVDITSLQHYTSMQDVYIVMDTVTATAGTPNVEVKLYGKCFEGDSYTYIGDSVVWTMAVADTPMKIQTTTANRYRYFRLEFISDATDQLSYIESVEFKQWFTGGALATADALTGLTSLTMSNGLTIDNAINNTLEFNENSDELIWTFGSNTITASSGDVTLFDYGTINLATDAFDVSDGDIANVGDISLDSIKGDGTTIAIGSNAENVAINSSGWDIDATGVVTGLGAITSNGKITTSDTVQAAAVTGIFNFATAAMVTGAADSIAITNASFPTLAAGVVVSFVAEAANTDVVRIDYNGTVDDLFEVAAGAPAGLEANDIRSGAFIMMGFDGTQWQMLTQSGN